MKKYLSGFLVFSLVFGALILPINQTNAAPVTIFSESFGDNNLGNDMDPISWNSWSDGGNSGDDAEIRVGSNGNNNDSVSPNGGRFAMALGQDGYFCKTIDTTGYNNVNLSYYWRGDSNANNNDFGLVQIKEAGNGIFCSDNSGWTTLKSHALDIDNNWSTQSAFTDNILNNKNLLLRFKVDANQNTEDFRVDGILISGDLIPVAPTTAKVTIVKYINGVPATPENTNNASFPMTATWNATNIGSGTGNYNLSSTGFNNPNPYQATTADMTTGADYSTYENTGTACVSPMMYALTGYTTGDTLNDATLAVPSLTTPSFTNLQTDKFVIVWNKTCVDLPTHLTPADNSVRTTAEQTLIDWSDVVSWASPVTYMYQSALSMATNMDGSFTSPAYTSGALTSSEIPTPGTPEGIYYWHVKATDSANNTSGWTIPWKITINNTGSLTVNKNVLKPDGVTEVSDNQSFSVMLNGGNTQNVSENISYTYTNLTPGTYTVTEGVNGNYEFVSFSNDSDSETAGAQVEVVANQNTVVTITNKQKKGTLTINKIVTNPNDGEAIATDFSFQVNGGEAIAFTDSDDENNLTGQNIISVDPGTYTITEVIPEGAYAISYSANCTNAVLTSNSNIVCTITNSDIPAGKGAITVVKNLPNDNGGDFVLSDFPLNVSGTTTEETPMSVSESVASGISEFFTPGTYVVSEDNPNELSGYTTTISCTDGENTLTNGNITVSDQQAWVCTITNDDEPAKLTIIKKVVNNAWMGTLEETFNFNLIGEDTEEEIAITTEAPEMMEEESKIYEQDYQAMGESEVITLNSGSYTLTEDLLPEWNLTDISCSVKTEETENGVYLSLQNGEDVTCTFVNTRKTGTLVIEKIVVNDDGKELTVSDFAGFTINNSEPIPFESDEDEMSGGKTVILELGTYQISEPVTEGYYKVTENCEAVNITEGTIKTCKFRNDDVGFFVHSGGSGSSGGQVLGASTETPAPSPTTPTETPKGEVLGATSCSTIYLNDFLYFGKKNNPEQVKLLQTFLNEELGLKLVVDGKFGRTTRNAVIAFQEKYGTDVLTPWAPFGLKSGKGTGNVYKTTKWKINMIKCADLKLEVPQLP